MHFTYVAEASGEPEGDNVDSDTLAPDDADLGVVSLGIVGDIWTFLYDGGRWNRNCFYHSTL